MGPADSEGFWARVFWSVAVPVGAVMWAIVSLLDTEER